MHNCSRPGSGENRSLLPSEEVFEDFEIDSLGTDGSSYRVIPHQGSTEYWPLPLYSSQTRLYRWLSYLLLALGRLRKALRWTHLVYAAAGFAAVSILHGVIHPSFQHPPERYDILYHKIHGSNVSGRGNIANQKIFVAANIINADMVNGAWGDALVQLVELLGEENVFVSIYENDSGTKTSAALQRLQKRLLCNFSIVTGDHLDLESLPKVLVNGEDRVQRITYLAEVRNRLLAPLRTKEGSQGFRSTETIFDKMLFINDVFFDPVEAVQLLFNTNDGVYRAACAIDFQHGIMFYDSFVVRDVAGYQIGLMFYPWFINGQSRDSVRQEVDAVPVRSCWGGMAAFDAAVFGNLTFRSSNESFWEAAECCLIFADMEATFGPGEVFINPYVRVAYTEKTWSWLPFWRRYEKMFENLQYIVSMIGYPEYNPRRKHAPGQPVVEKVWKDDHWTELHREAEPGGFCGQRRMFIMKRDIEAANIEGKGKNWEKVTVPKGL